MKNNVWKKHKLSIPNGIDNYIKITKIKLDSASLNRNHKSWNPQTSGFRDFFFCSATNLLLIATTLYHIVSVAN